MCRWLCVLGIEYRHVPVEEVRFYVKRDDGHTSFKSHTALKRRGGSDSACYSDNQTFRLQDSPHPQVKNEMWPLLGVINGASVPR